MAKIVTEKAMASFHNLYQATQPTSQNETTLDHTTHGIFSEILLKKLIAGGLE